jgi:glycosyltransferase 2 family protein
MAKKRKIIFNIVRIVVSISLLALLIVINREEFRLILEDIEKIDFIYFSIAVFLYFLGIAGMIFRWDILLKSQKLKISSLFLLQAVLIGFFYNNILPTSIGGDAYRVYDLKRNRDIAISSSTSTVMIERSIGTVSGALFLVFSLAFGMYRFLDLNMAINLIIVFVLFILLFAIIINPYFFKVDVIFEKFKWLRKIRPKMRSFRETVISYKDKKKFLFISFIYSLVIQFFIILSYYLLSRSINTGLGLSRFFFMVPFISIVSSIPLTIGGLGLRENAIVFLMNEFGVSNDLSFLYSISVLIIILINGLLGGIVYLVKSILISRDIYGLK